LSTALLVGYLAFLGLALLAPFLARPVRAGSGVQAFGFDLLACIGMLGAFALLIARGGNFFPLAPLLLTPLLVAGSRKLVGGAASLLLFVPAIWWSDAPAKLPPWQWVLFAILAAAAGCAVHFGRFTGAGKTDEARAAVMPAFIFAALVALAIGWITAPFDVDTIAHTAWHHWGAYLSPVDLLLSGGTPYRDFPVQYGIGPTLLLAASCGNDCWAGMFNVVLVTNALYFGTLAACTAIITTGMVRGIRWLSWVAMFCAALFWTAFPAEFSTSMATPSAVALRFLPLAFQLLFVLYCEKNPQQPKHLGHLIWLLNSFWSIESAVFASVLWWPWLAYRAHQKREASISIVQLLGRYAVMGALALLVSTALMLTLFRLGFGVWPEPVSIFAYFQHPPGPLPPNPLGPLGLVIMLTALTVQTLLRGRARDGGTLYACLIAMLASFSYYLSRSHDNNILNLLPFVLLVTLCLLPKVGERSESEREFNTGFATMFVMATIAFVATFNFSAWSEVTRSKGQLETGPRPLLRQFSPSASDPSAVISKDARGLIALARRNSRTAPVLFDKRAVMPRAEAGRAWTSVNSIANYSPLPQPLVSNYIGRGAETYRLSGWLIVEDGRYAQWPEYFATAYDVKPIMRKGRHVAYFLRPKLPVKR
jgi:hypothetical protein